MFSDIDVSGPEPLIVVGRIIDVIGVDADAADQTPAKIVNYAEAARRLGGAFVQPAHSSPR